MIAGKGSFSYGAGPFLGNLPLPIPNGHPPMVNARAISARYIQHPQGNRGR